MKEIIHLASDYPCSHCGAFETYCDKELSDEYEVNWTMDEDKITCKKCIAAIKKIEKHKREYKSRNI